MAIIEPAFMRGLVKSQPDAQKEICQTAEKPGLLGKA